LLIAIGGAVVQGTAERTKSPKIVFICSAVNQCAVDRTNPIGVSRSGAICQGTVVGINTAVTIIVCGAVCQRAILGYNSVVNIIVGGTINQCAVDSKNSISAIIVHGTIG